MFWIYQDASNSLEVLQNKYNIHYWDEWPSKDWPGTIGARYGEVVRRYDLMRNLLKGLKEDPYGRRHVIDLWQYKDGFEKDYSDALNWLYNRIKWLDVQFSSVNNLYKPIYFL